jgi:hypothetical protein
MGVGVGFGDAAHVSMIGSGVVWLCVDRTRVRVWVWLGEVLQVRIWRVLYRKGLGWSDGGRSGKECILWGQEPWTMVGARLDG